jgi:hypothetical protein
MDTQTKYKKIQEVLDNPELKGIYNTALDSEQGARFLLNLLHKRTSVAKCDIVEYLNAKGFNYATDRQSNS